MITLARPLHPDGYVFDLLCPVFLCDACGRPIDDATGGNVLWWDSPDNNPCPVPGLLAERLYFCHKRRCDRALDPHADLYSQELREFAEQLLNNYRRPLLGAELTDHNGRAWTVQKVQAMA